MSFLEYVMLKIQRPEVVIMAVWWLVTLLVVAYTTEVGSVFWDIAKPVALLASIPLVFLLFLCFFA